jgi:hypothetical protein
MQFSSNQYYEIHWDGARLTQIDPSNTSQGDPGN